MANYEQWYQDYHRKVATPVWDMIEYGMVRASSLTNFMKVGALDKRSEIDDVLCPELLMLSCFEILQLLFNFNRIEEIAKESTKIRELIVEKDAEMAEIYRQTVESVTVMKKSAPSVPPLFVPPAPVPKKDEPDGTAHPEEDGDDALYFEDDDMFPEPDDDGFTEEDEFPDDLFDNIEEEELSDDDFESIGEDELPDDFFDNIEEDLPEGFLDLPEDIDEEVPFVAPKKDAALPEGKIIKPGTPEYREMEKTAVLSSKKLTAAAKKRYSALYAEVLELEKTLDQRRDERENRRKTVRELETYGGNSFRDYSHADAFLDFINDVLIQRMMDAIRAAIHLDPEPLRRECRIALSHPGQPSAAIYLLRKRFFDRSGYLNREGFCDRLNLLFRNGTPLGCGQVTVKDVMSFCVQYLEEENEAARETVEDCVTSLSKGGLKERAKLYRQFYTRITEKVVAQDAAVSRFLRGLFEGSMVAMKDRSGPEASYLFMGPPGVGKTYLANVAAKLMGRPCRVYQMSEYAHDSSFNGLVGFERTWKAAQPGDLTSYVMENPDAILIFDEVEKAHQRTLRLFLSLLEGGTMRDIYYERDVDFRKTIVIFTTNAGRQFYEERRDMRISALPVQVLTDALKKDIDPVSNKQVLPNELVSRLEKGNIIGFDHMTPIRLLPIIRNGIEEGLKEAEESLKIRCSYDREKLPHLLLFRIGTMLDARVAGAKSRDFIKEMLYALTERLGEGGRKYGKREYADIRIRADRNAVTKELLHLPKGENGKRFLVFTYANNKKYSACFENEIDGKLQRFLAVLYRGKGSVEEDGANDIRALLRHNEFDAILIDPLWWKNAGASARGAKNNGMEGVIHQNTRGNALLKWLLTQTKIPPVYALAFDKGYDLTDRLELQECGVREVLELSTSDPEGCRKRLDELAYELFLNEKLDRLVSRGRSLDFKIRYQIGKAGKEQEDATGGVTIQLYDFKKVTSLSTDAENVIVPDVNRKGRGFDDVIGAKDAVDALKHFIYYIRDPKGYRRTGQRVSKGILLYGPPGTGKTMLARALSQEADCPFIAVSGSQLINGDRKVGEVFALARKYGPSILFIDEIDAVAMSRGFSRGVSNPVLNELLTQMDGFDKDAEHPVFVIAATNAAEKPGLSGHQIYIDSALQRRFTKKIYVDLPDKEERIKYLEMRIEAIRDGEYNFNALSRDEIEQFAVQTAGYSIGDIENVIDTTISTAVDERMRSITLELMIRCFEESMYGEKLKVDKSYIRSVAIHEIGHAYLSFLGGERFTPQYATVVARANYLGMVSTIPEEVARGLPKADILRRIRICLAGRAAEQVCLGEEEGMEAGADNDLMKATHYTALLIGLFGMEEGFLPVISLRGDVHPMEQMMNSPLAEKYYAKINEILTREMETTKELIRRNRKNIENAADALLEKSRLNTKELRRLLKPSRRAMDL